MRVMRVRKPATTLLLLTLGASPVLEARASDWLSPGGGLWHDVGNWSGGIPDIAGANATFNALFPAGVASMELGGGITTLGSINALDPDQLSLVNGTLVFEQATPGTAAQVSVGGGVLTLGTDIVLNDALQLEAELGAELWLTQSRFGIADMTVSGGAAASGSAGGTVFLNDDASAWTGTLTVLSGTVNVFNADALGAGSSTRIVGGQLRLIGNVNESIEINGGELHLQNAGTYTMPIVFTDGRIVADNRVTLTGPIHLPEEGSTEFDGSFVFNTAVTGDNSLVWRLHNGYSEINASLDITGGLLVDSSSASNRLDFNTASTYTGITELSIGRFNVHDALGLGSAEAGTVIHSGELAVYAITQETITLNAPGKLTIQDGGEIGSLTSFGGELVHHGEFLAPTSLADGETLWRADNGRIDSTISGTGDLRLNGATIFSANDYTGTTTISGSQPVITQHVMALGSAEGATVVGNGRLLIDVASLEPIRVEKGSVDFRATDAPNLNPLTLAGGQAAASGGHAGAVTVESESTLGYGRFSGPISGEARLLLGDDSPSTSLTIAGANPFAGVVWGSEGDVVFERSDVFNHAERIVHERDGLTLIDGSDRTVLVAAGQLRIENDTTLGGLWHVGGHVGGGGDVTFDRVVASQFHEGNQAAGTVTINDFLMIHSLGHIYSDIQGPGDIIFDNSYSDIYGDLAGVAGDIVLINGDFRGHSSASFGGVDTTLRFVAGSTATLRVEPEDNLTTQIIGTIDATATDVATIFGHVSGSIVLSDGSELVAEDLVNDYVLVLAGTIDAHDLTIAGGALVGADLSGLTGDLTASQHAGRLISDYTNPVVFTVAEQGSIQDIDRLILDNGTPLLIDNDFQPDLDSIASQDRLGDQIEIVSDAGSIMLQGHETQAVSERIGTVVLQQGRTQVSVQETMGQDTTLVIGSVARQGRATLGFYREGSVSGEQQLLNPGVLPGVMIAPWMTTMDGFATVDAQGYVTTVAATSSDFNTATSTDHLLIQASQILSSDVTVRSAVIGAYPQRVAVDLGRHQLTIDGGGLFFVERSDVINGTLTSGTDELVMTAAPRRVGNGGTAEVFFDVDIVDNGAPIALVIEALDVEFHGQLLHTGGTWVYNSSVTHRTLDSYPVGGDLFLHSSSYGIDLIEDESGPMPEFGVITLAGGAGFWGLKHDREYRPVSAEEIHLLDGRVDADLHGDGLIIQRGSGLSSLGEMNNFTGEVRVESGRLVFNRLHEDVEINVLGGVLDVTDAPSCSKNLATRLPS